MIPQVSSVLAIVRELRLKEPSAYSERHSRLYKAIAELDKQPADTQVQDLTVVVHRLWNALLKRLLTMMGQMNRVRDIPGTLTASLTATEHEEVVEALLALDSAPNDTHTVEADALLKRLIVMFGRMSRIGAMPGTLTLSLTAEERRDTITDGWILLNETQEHNREPQSPQKSART